MLNNLPNINRIGSTPVGSYFLYAILFANLSIYFKGNQIAEKFNCRPSKPIMYLASILTEEEVQRGLEIYKQEPNLLIK